MRLIGSDTCTRAPSGLFELLSADARARALGERGKFFRLHRRFDAYDRTVTFLADELPQQPAEVRG